MDSKIFSKNRPKNTTFSMNQNLVNRLQGGYLYFDEKNGKSFFFQQKSLRSCKFSYVRRKLTFNVLNLFRNPPCRIYLSFLKIVHDFYEKTCEQSVQFISNHPVFVEDTGAHVYLKMLNLYLDQMIDQCGVRNVQEMTYDFIHSMLVKILQGWCENMLIQKD